MCQNILKLTIRLQLINALGIFIVSLTNVKKCCNLIVSLSSLLLYCIVTQVVCLNIYSIYILQFHGFSVAVSFCYISYILKFFLYYLSKTSWIRTVLQGIQTSVQESAVLVCCLWFRVVKENKIKTPSYHSSLLYTLPNIKRALVCYSICRICP